MNALVSFLVTVVSVLIVGGIAIVGVNHVLGDWAPLAWIAIGWFALMAVMKAVNS